jgi:hypothetical protein
MEWSGAKLIKNQSIPYYHDLYEAFTKPGCAFCRLLHRDADKYIESILWEMVNDPETREEINQARGYCNQHAWMMVREGAALGIAILMQDVIKTLLNTLETQQIDSEFQSSLGQLMGSLAQGRRQGTAKLVDNLSPQTSCPVCSWVGSIETHYINTLLKHLNGSKSLAEVYRESDGLCLSHFQKTLSKASTGNVRNTLIDAQRTVWEHLYDDLGEFIRKKDYRFKDESYGEEKDSWRRGIEAISGAAPQVGGGKV